MKLARTSLIAAAVLLVFGGALDARAAPVTYELTTGSLTTIQLQPFPSGASICPLGGANCLVNSPVSLDIGSVTLDLATNTLINLTVHTAGPGILAMGGINGYDQVTFSDATFQSSLATALTPSGPQYNFASPGIISVGAVELDFAAPNPSPNVIVPYSASTTPSGNISFDENNKLILTLTGVDLGIFTDPLTGLNPVVAKADFTFTAAAVPEPGAALLYGVGLLIAGTAVRRRSRIVHC